MKLTEDEKNIFPEFPSIVFDELTKKYSIEITAKDAIKADDQRQQILDDYEKARKWDYVVDETGSKLFDGYITGQKLRELIEKKREEIIKNPEKHEEFCSVELQALLQKLLGDSKKIISVD